MSPGTSASSNSSIGINAGIESLWSRRGRREAARDLNSVQGRCEGRGVGRPCKPYNTVAISIEYPTLLNADKVSISLRAADTRELLEGTRALPLLGDTSTCSTWVLLHSGNVCWYRTSWRTACASKYPFRLSIRLCLLIDGNPIIKSFGLLYRIIHGNCFKLISL